MIKIIWHTANSTWVDQLLFQSLNANPDVIENNVQAIREVHFKI